MNTIPLSIDTVNLISDLNINNTGKTKQITQLSTDTVNIISELMKLNNDNHSESQEENILPIVHNPNLTRETHDIGDYIKRDINSVEGSIKNDISNDMISIKSELRSDTANILTQLNAQHNANMSGINASEIESRQAIERNADNITNNIHNASTQGLLATQNASTQGLLATQNASTKGLLATQISSTDTLLAIQHSTVAIQNALGNANARAEIIAAEYRGIIYNQTEILLSETKNLQVLQCESKATLQLQISESKAALQLQAAEYKSYLENHITKTIGDIILKTFEITEKILEKIAECRCELHEHHSTTQNTIVQNTNNIKNAIQNSDNNRLQQTLVAAQQEALLARFNRT